MAEEHLLRDRWVAWEQYETHGNDYADEMAEIVGFNTVEGFWRFFENFPKMSAILFDGMTKKRLSRVTGDEQQAPQGNVIRAVSVFKRGVRPEWEAKGNAGGGFFALKKLNNLRQLDALYESLALGVVGGSADSHNVVNGIRVVDKSAHGRCNYKLEIWLGACSQLQLDETRAKLGSLLQAAVPHSKLALPLGFTRFHAPTSAATADV